VCVQNDDAFSSSVCASRDSDDRNLSKEGHENFTHDYKIISGRMCEEMRTRDLKNTKLKTLNSRVGLSINTQKKKTKKLYIRARKKFTSSQYSPPKPHNIIPSLMPTCYTIFI
jgi:hypothetical protein